MAVPPTPNYKSDYNIDIPALLVIIDPLAKPPIIRDTYPAYQSSEFYDDRLRDSYDLEQYAPWFTESRFFGSYDTELVRARQRRIKNWKKSRRAAREREKEIERKGGRDAYDWSLEFIACLGKDGALLKRRPALAAPEVVYKKFTGTPVKAQLYLSRRVPPRWFYNAVVTYRLLSRQHQRHIARRFLRKSARSAASVSIRQRRFVLIMRSRLRKNRIKGFLKKPRPHKGLKSAILKRLNVTYRKPMRTILSSFLRLGHNTASLHAEKAITDRQRSSALQYAESTYTFCISSDNFCRKRERAATTAKKFYRRALHLLLQARKDRRLLKSARIKLIKVSTLRRRTRQPLRDSYCRVLCVNYTKTYFRRLPDGPRSLFNLISMLSYHAPIYRNRGFPISFLARFCLALYIYHFYSYYKHDYWFRDARESVHLLGEIYDKALYKGELMEYFQWYPQPNPRRGYDRLYSFYKRQPSDSYDWALHFFFGERHWLDDPEYDDPAYYTPVETVLLRSIDKYQELKAYVWEVIHFHRNIQVLVYGTSLVVRRLGAKKLISLAEVLPYDARYKAGVIVQVPASILFEPQLLSRWCLSGVYYHDTAKPATKRPAVNSDLIDVRQRSLTLVRSEERFARLRTDYFQFSGLSDEGAVSRDPWVPLWVREEGFIRVCCRVPHPKRYNALHLDEVEFEEDEEGPFYFYYATEFFPGNRANEYNGFASDDTRRLSWHESMDHSWSLFVPDHTPRAKPLPFESRYDVPGMFGATVFVRKCQFEDENPRYFPIRTRVSSFVVSNTNVVDFTDKAGINYIYKPYTGPIVIEDDPIDPNSLSYDPYAERDEVIAVEADLNDRNKNNINRLLGCAVASVDKHELQFDVAHQGYDLGRFLDELNYSVCYQAKITPSAVELKMKKAWALRMLRWNYWNYFIEILALKLEYAEHASDILAYFRSSNHSWAVIGNRHYGALAIDAWRRTPSATAFEFGANITTPMRLTYEYPTNPDSNHQKVMERNEKFEQAYPLTLEPRLLGSQISRAFVRLFAGKVRRKQIRRRPARFRLSIRLKRCARSIINAGHVHDIVKYSTRGSRRSYRARNRRTKKKWYNKIKPRSFRIPYRPRGRRVGSPVHQRSPFFWKTTRIERRYFRRRLDYVFINGVPTPNRKRVRPSWEVAHPNCRFRLLESWRSEELRTEFLLDVYTHWFPARLCMRRLMLALKSPAAIPVICAGFDPLFAELDHATKTRVPEVIEDNIPRFADDEELQSDKEFTAIVAKPIIGGPGYGDAIRLRPNFEEDPLRGAIVDVIEGNTDESIVENAAPIYKYISTDPRSGAGINFSDDIGDYLENTGRGQYVPYKPRTFREKFPEFFDDDSEDSDPVTQYEHPDGDEDEQTDDSEDGEAN